MVFSFRFPKRPFPTASSSNTSAGSNIGISYRRWLNQYPFLVFGLPFVATMLAGSFFLTPATAVRYEKFDRKTHMLGKEEALGLDKLREAGRMRSRLGKPDIREEYYRLAGRRENLDDWEPIRVKRRPGEPDGTFD